MKIKFVLKKTSLTLFLIFVSSVLYAQHGDVTRAFTEIQTSLSSYVSAISNICLIIGAIIGTIGGVRIYIKWNNGDPDTQKSVVGWVAACIFLILTGVVIRALFGVG